MKETKKFGVISLGCDKNRVDSEKCISMMQNAGYTLTSDAQKAQIVIINTCAFLQSAREESVDTVLETAGYKSGNLEKIVVTGCLPQKFSKELFSSLSEGDIFLGVNDYDLLPSAIKKSYETGERINLVGKGSDTFRFARTLTTAPYLAYLKIADGCYNHCTYCLIPKIRGRYRSYPAENLIEEARNLGEVKELVLVAQDTTRYGEDLYGENRFPQLIRELSGLDNIKKIRLLYCYPDAFSSELISEIKTNDKVLKYVDIPLQHSENRILKLMNRRGTREEYLALIRRLKEEIPGIAIRSTFISGFPSETEEEFNAMRAFIKEARLFNCGFFAYSKEPETAAAKMKNQVHYKTKRRRVRQLYETQSAVAQSILLSYVGKTVRVLCEGVDYERGQFFGRPYFFAPEIDGKVYFNANEATEGEEYDVLILSAAFPDLTGRTEDYKRRTEDYKRKKGEAEE
ncbi:MAG: 30S ribosomal protein S12 methylthiotransferase RimO [Candidatus Borkfalkiaceae bacterium]|nr:30S ribosomal protein S12 methylthiotransferase RimO [Clostridia bacterium]MDY6223427.1 30S ribosomal protein S12 methylthiotransferase RimO [Christensenellaceae bacterium]